MQTTLCAQWEGSNELEITCNLNVVIAFEDLIAGKHAQRFYEYLMDRLGANFEFTRHQWNFGLLTDPNIREAAAHDAATADIIIVATHGEGELPEHVEAWIKLWVGRNANQTALVALFDRPSRSGEQRESVRSHLQEIANAAGMQFFAEPEDSPNFEIVPFPDEVTHTDQSIAAIA